MFRHAFSLLASAGMFIGGSLLCSAQVNPDISVDSQFTSGSPATYYQVTPGTSASITASLVTHSVLTNVDTRNRFFGLDCQSSYSAFNSPNHAVHTRPFTGFGSKPSKNLHPGEMLTVDFTITGTDDLPIGTYDFIGSGTATEPKTGFDIISPDQIVGVQVAPYA